MEETVQVAPKKSRNLLIIGLAVVAVVLLIAGGIVLMSFRSGNTTPTPTSPQIVASKSNYLQYEIRNNEVYLNYNITISNPTEDSYEHFRLSGNFSKDFDNGFILDANASAAEKLTGRDSFSIAPGETLTLNLLFTASYFKNSASPSRELPKIYLTTYSAEKMELPLADESES